MAITETLLVGPPNTLVQNVEYGLPNRVVRVHSSAAVEISADGSAWDALTGADTVGAEAGSYLIRCPGGAATVVLRSLR